MLKKELPKFYKRQIEAELERTLAGLNRSSTDSEEYAKILTVAERLHGMLDEEKTSDSVSKEALASIGANLLGILMIIKHESVNVITSKALSFVIRTKV